MKTILITGTRNILSLDDQNIIINRLKLIQDDDVTLVHGGATGVDTFCNNFGKNAGWKLIKFKANWNKYGKQAGPLRNIDMVDFSNPDLILGFPGPNSKGTWHCINYAKKINKCPIEIINLNS